MTTMSMKQRAKLARQRSVAHRRTLTKASALSAVLLVGVLIAFQVLARGEVVEPPVGEGRILGDPNAPVTIVEYADFQCPVCRRAATDLIPRLEEDYVNSGKVNIEYRYFPFLGQESWDAAQAAAAAEEQGKFWEYYAALYNAQGRENGGAFSYDRLLQLAEDVGLDMARFDATLASNVNLKTVQAEVDAARDRGIRSTPTFMVGETKIVGMQDYQKFVDAIEKELARVDDEAAQ